MQRFQTLAEFPTLASQWDHTRNTSTPDEVSALSTEKVFWSCPAANDHRWQTTPRNRVKEYPECPFCTGRRASSTNNLALHVPAVAALWDYTRNGELTPQQVLPGAAARVWWACPKGDDHRWDGVIRDRVRKNAGCPYCTNQKASITNCLATVSPELSAQWDLTLNAPTTPYDVVAKAGKQAWWRCPNGPDHVWKTTPNERAKGKGCPFCSPTPRRVSTTNCLAAAFPDVAAQWHPTLNGSLTPADVPASTSGQLAWWVCPESNDHFWQATVASRTSSKAGCPFCVGKQVCPKNSLAVCRPDIAAQWHPDLNDVSPDEVTVSSGKTAWWVCPGDVEHVWNATIGNRTANGSGCPHCSLVMRSAKEVRIAFELAAVLSADPLQHRVEIAGKVRDVDFLDRTRHVAVEYDGNYWHADREDRDRRKNADLIGAGFTVIRIREHPLPLLTEHDVSASTVDTPHLLAARVLHRMSDLGITDRTLATDYAAHTAPIASLAAEKYLQQLRAKSSISSQPALF